MTVDTLNVELGTRSYPILIAGGLLGRAEIFEQHLRARELLIVSNTTVAPLYLPTLTASLGTRRLVEVVLPDGEAHKTLANASRVLDVLVANRLPRDCAVLALGGGVVGDLAGFAAACYQRGVDFVQLPTTLLAQVDSAVGGKTGVNHVGGKNLIGAFHQPVLVVNDTATLATLPPRELRAGLAEVIKHALALDLPFVEWLEGSVQKLLNRERPALTYAVKRCCELKAGIVAADEREAGVRALLNFGHTFGHAIEAGAGYGSWLHGEAIAAGMVMASELSLGLNLIGKADVARVKRLIERAGLPLRGPALAPQKLIELMAGDKKAAQGRLRFVVLETLGRAAVRGGVDEQRIREAIVAAAQ